MFWSLEEERGRGSLEEKKCITSLRRGRPGRALRGPQGGGRLLQWFSHIFEDITLVLYLAPNGILCKTLICEWSKKRNALVGTQGQEPTVFSWAVAWEPKTPVSCWETTGFKVPQVFSKEGPGELPAESWNFWAEEGRNFCPDACGGRLCSGEQTGLQTAALPGCPVQSQAGPAAESPACVCDGARAEGVCTGPSFLEVTGTASRSLRRGDPRRPGRWIDSGATSASAVALSPYFSVKMISC